MAVPLKICPAFAGAVPITIADEDGRPTRVVPATFDDGSAGVADEDEWTMTMMRFDAATTPIETTGGLRLATSERRRGLRIRQVRPVKVLDAVGGRYYGGQTRDVSATGLQVELPAHAAVRVGAVLHVLVGLTAAGSSLANRRQMVPARVVWVERTAWSATATVLAGVEFATGIAAELHAA